jgi:cytoskeletal protein CcmA (bactofilin family)
MFGKTSRLMGSVVGGSAAATTVPSIIGPDMSVRGDLHSDGDLHVEGTIQGDIRVKHLVVGKDAVVRGDVEATTVRVSGSVAGSLRAREVILTATAKMQGDVYHEVLSIEPGALLEGHCRRLEPTLSTDEPLTLTKTAPPAPAEGTRLALQAPTRRAAH